MSPQSTTGHTIFGGRYAVEAPLGSGATATVYLCRDRTTMSSVAVKVLHTDLAESVGAERFLREIRLTSGLDHPSILPVMDSGADGSILWCVLPYMEGGTLRDLLREKKQLAIAEAIDIGKTIAEALAYAHDRGLIHRDIKPENILFSKGKAYLGDFGIARALYATASDLTTTTTGVIRGTPAYMSPEQASGERNYDGRSDIYSLGSVVYEMISGMPPFIGPTAHSVMVQRFNSTPREMRTYRASVTIELERVVAKAMATTPADRYPTCRDFSEALTSAERVNSVPARHRPVWLIGAAAVLLVTLGALYLARGRSFVRTPPLLVPDTTQLAVLPFEKDGDVRELGSVDALVYNAFSAWQGVTVVEPYRVRDVMARQTLSGVDRDRSAAVALGIGRFIRGEVAVLPARAGWRIQAWLHQIGARDTVLYQASITITPRDLASIDRAYAKLASQLLFRGADGSATDTPVMTTTSVPAMQSFAAGVDAIDDWDFDRADSLFARAVERDPQYGRAALWQAQARFWQRQPPDQWVSLVDIALRDTTRLPARDLDLARALRAVGVGDFDRACNVYDGLRRQNSSDFAAWFGLGRCRELDYRVEPDSRSPTGWRYHASYQQAVSAYEQAFKVLPVSHRSFERSAFEPLRDLLFLKPSKFQRAQVPPGSNLAFAGRLDRAGDTLLLRPIPLALVTAGDPAAVPAGLQDAIRSQRALFRRIASAWSVALPRSAAAKEGVATALEMVGERSALDTLRAGRALASDPLIVLRLAVADLVMRVKFAQLTDTGEFRAIKLVGDSLLAAHRTPSPAEAAYIATVAALTGKCGALGALLRKYPITAANGVPPDLRGSADAFLGEAAIGCSSDERAEVLRVQQRIVALPNARPGIDVSLLLRGVLLLEGRDTILLRPFAGGAYLARVQLAVARHQLDTVRQVLAAVEQSRQLTGWDDIAPDAAYLEAKALVAIGDSAAARRLLDRVLDRRAFLTPGMLNHPASMAGFIRMMLLADTLKPRSARAEPSVTAASILWSDADDGVKKRLP